MLSNLEDASEFVVKGWALNEADLSGTISLDVFVNRQLIARLPSNTYRSDLQSAGYGDGHHAFFFNPFDYLCGRENLIEVCESSSRRQVNGSPCSVTSPVASNRARYDEAKVRSQRRWNRLSGTPLEEPFLRYLLGAAHFHPALRILELGSGTGELFCGLRDTGSHWGSYLGVDLSRASAERMHARYADQNVRFLAGDAARYPYDGHFDLIFASGLCETLFPSFLPLARNVSRVMETGRIFAFDLAVEDDRASVSRAEWQGDNYLRFYSRAEIRRLLTEAGMEMVQADIYERNAGEYRLFVTGLKTFTPPKSKFEIL